MSAGHNINLTGGKIGAGAAVGVTAAPGAALAVGKNAKATGSNNSGNVGSNSAVGVTAGGNLAVGQGASAGRGGGGQAAGDNVQSADSEMGQILQSLNLEKYLPAFTDHGILPEHVADLTDVEWEKLGVTKIGDKKSIRKACQPK